MAYYNRDGEKLKIDRKKLEYLGHGQCADVYKYKDDDTIFKEYSDSVLAYRLVPEVFDVLKAINDNHLMKVYDIYENRDLKREIDSFIVDAYTAKYYKKDGTQILTEPTEYLLENLYELERIFNTLADNRVAVNDLRSANTIVNKEMVTIIDPDCFYKVDATEEAIKNANKHQLLHFIRDICLDEYSSIELGHLGYLDVYRMIHQSILDEFYAIINNISEKESATQKVKQMLENTKRPIDYFLLV